MKVTLTLEELKNLIAKNKDVDETVLDYICTIVSEGNLEDILEGVPPLLISSGLTDSDESAKLTTADILQHTKLIKNKEDINKINQLETLKESIQISSQQSESQYDLPSSAFSSKNNLNTYEVVNMDKMPIEEFEEACVSLEKFIELTKVEDPKKRKLALRELCPCHVKRDVKEFWDRIIEMRTDPDPGVRYQVLHNLCDGSPKTREIEVIAAIEDMHNDEDKYIRRRVHQVLACYRRTGKWNIL